MNTGRLSVLTACLFLTITAIAQTPGVYLGDLSWPEAEHRFSESPIVIVPFGAGAKEHGPHLPMNADRVVMDYLLATAVESKNVIVAPPVLHGWFPAFRDFPGTEVADPAVFQAYVQQVGMSLARHGAQRIVFLNTGISKATGLPISIAAREIRVQTGVPTLVVSWDDLETDELSALQEQVVGGHGDEMLSYLSHQSFAQFSQVDTLISDETRMHYVGHVPAFIRWFPFQYFHPLLRPLWQGEAGEMARVSFDEVEPGDNSLRFSGDVYLLVGPGTMSSASLLAATLQKHKLATLVGSPAGGYATLYGNVIDVYLPHTGLKVWMPTGIVYGNSFGPIVPEHVVSQSVQDIVRRRDTVLEYTVELARSK